MPKTGGSQVVRAKIKTETRKPRNKAEMEKK